MNGVHFSSEKTDWETPQRFFDAINAEFGFTLDSCATDGNAKVNKWITPEMDSLKYPWVGVVWMNPPYSGDLIGRFSEKLSTHYAAGDVREAIVLVNNATETTWFQGMMVHAAAVCFVRRRIKFIDTDGNPSGAPLQGQAILYMGDNADLFTDCFSEFGTVLYGKRAGRNS